MRITFGPKHEAHGKSPPQRTDREFVSKFDAFEEQVRGALAPPRARRAAARTLPPALRPAVRAVCAHRSRRGCVRTVRQD
jgi:hypothetical protein